MRVGKRVFSGRDEVLKGSASLETVLASESAPLVQLYVASVKTPHIKPGSP